MGRKSESATVVLKPIPLDSDAFDPHLWVMKQTQRKQPRPPIRDDGWRLPDVLWEEMEPLLPPRPYHPLGCHNPRVPALRQAQEQGDGRDLLRAAHRLPMECPERDRHLLVLLSLSKGRLIGASRNGRRRGSSPPSGTRVCWPMTNSPASIGVGWHSTGPWERRRWVGKKTGPN